MGFECPHSIFTCTDCLARDEANAKWTLGRPSFVAGSARYIITAELNGHRYVTTAEFGDERAYYDLDHGEEWDDDVDGRIIAYREMPEPYSPRED